MANTVEIHVRSVDHTRGFADVRRSIQGLSRDARDADGPLDGMAGKLAILGGAAKGLSLILKPNIFAELIPVALGAAAAAVEMSGALLVLPGAAASAGVAVGALAIATMGFGDALKEMDDPKKFEEALKNLAPAAQETARAIRDELKPAFDSLRKSLQQNLFAGLAKEITATGASLINTFKPAFDRITIAANKTLKGFLQDLRSTERANLSSIGRNAAASFESLMQAVRPISRALLDIMEVGARVFAGLTGGAGKAAASFERWITGLKESGKLEAIMKRGIEAVTQFGRVLRNTGSFLNSFFQAADVSGAGFLDTLEKISAQMAAFGKSAQGQEAFKIFFDLVKAIQVVVAELEPLGPAFLTVMQAITDGLNKAAPAVTPLAEAFGRTMEILSPLLPVLGEIAGIIMNALTGALNAVNPALAEFVPKLGEGLLAAARDSAPLVTALADTLGFLITKLDLVLPAINGIITALTIELPGGLSVAEVLIYGWAIKVAAHWALVAAGAVTATITTTIEVAKQLVQWTILAAGATARALIVAGAWVIAMGPVGWAVAALAAAVILIIANWDKIKEHARAFGQWFASDFPNFIRGGIDAALQFLGTDFPNGVRSAIDGVVNFFTTTLPDGVRRGIDAVLGVLRALPGQVVSIGSDIVQGIWRGIQAGWQWLKDQVANLARSLFDAAKAALGIGSPSKLFRDLVGKMIPEGIAVGIRLNSKSARNALQHLMDRLKPRPGGGGTGGRAGVPSLVAPRMAYADFNRGASFGGSAATVRSATHAVNRAIPGRYESAASGGSGGPPVVIGRQTMLGQLIAEILRRECRINGGNVQLWLGAG